MGTGTSSDSAPDDGGLVFDVEVADFNPSVGEATCEQAAASLTSAGCSFAPIVGNPSSSAFMGPLPWAVIAANANVQPATVTLYDTDGVELGTEVIDPGDLHVFELTGPENAPMEHPGTSAVHRALRLESDIPIVAYQFQPYSTSSIAISDASLLLPEHAWSDNYLNFNASNDGEQWLIVASLEDGVEVTVEAPNFMVGTSNPGPGIPPLGASQQHVEILDRQDTLKIHSGSADLTGMRVYADGGNVALYTGSPGMSLPGPGFQQYRDYLEEQLPPRESWGTEYAAIKYRPRTNEQDIYRIIADKDGTIVQITGDYTDNFALNEGEFVQFETDGNFLATGNEAFAVAHFMPSCSESTGAFDPSEYPGTFEATNNCMGSALASDMGDPAVSFVVPTAQFRSRYTFLVPFTYAWDMLTVVAPTGQWGSIDLDGAPLPPSTPLGFGGLSYARFLLDDGPHVIESAEAAFGVEVYGYDCRISYAYPGGLSLGSINVPPAG
ncbi:MAG: IgGFc-binding protein [Myxococcota bacterium]